MKSNSIFYERRWYNSIVFKISALFLLVALIVIAVCGISIFTVQTKEFEERSIEQMKHIGTMLRDTMEAEELNMVEFQEYMLEHSLEIEIPYDFGDEFVEAEEEKFNRAFREKYPNKEFGKDILFGQLTGDLKNQFCKYYHAKWFLFFEKVRGWYDIPYTYYVYPNGNGTHVIYIFDTERTYEGEEAENRLHLCDDYEENYEDMPYLFDTWAAGKMLDGMDSFDNEYGRTYSYYVPLYINEMKQGLICIDMDIDYVNSNILQNVVSLVSFSALAMVAGLALLAVIINRAYIVKLGRITGFIKEYSDKKDVATADALEATIKGRDEISELGFQISGMMRSLDEYMRNLTRTEQELAESQQTALLDALTGVKNKLAYDEELKKEQWNIENGDRDVGIIMIDLNYLKRINDTFGHERGNITITKLCHIVCDVFKHSPVYRIGGDEFVVLLRGKDFDNRDSLVSLFEKTLELQKENPLLNPWETVSAALGMAVYDPNVDSSIANVFKRADDAMYTRKKEMKAFRE